MSHSVTPLKRQHIGDSTELNGKKFQKTSSFDSPNEPRKSTSGADVFRVLCPSSKIESLVGQEENIMSHIRKETGAIIRIHGPISGSDERVIYIMGPDKEVQNNEQSNDNNGESKSAKDQVNSEDHKDKDNVNGNAKGNDDHQNALLTAGDAHSDTGTSCVQRALLLVFEKFIDGEKQTEVTDKESNGTVTFRLLVLSSQVGCLLGRGGSIIKQLSTKSGAQIEVLSKDKLPQCASSMDDVVQIIGEGDAVKRAIKSVLDQIMENANGNHDVLPSVSPRPTLHSRNQPVSRSKSQSTRPLGFQEAPFGRRFGEGADRRLNIPPFIPKLHENSVTLRLLCPDWRVGGLIGKGAAIVKILRQQTGCNIKVLEGSSEGEERVVVISGQAHPDDRLSPVQDAMLRVLHRIGKPNPDSKDKGITAKFLIHSNQIGCLVGRGGSVIAEMQKVTGALISILGKDQLPKNASKDDEVIQINGEFEVVREAALQITSRLLHHFFRDAFPLMLSDISSPFSSYMGRQELPSTLDPSFRNFDSIGAPPFYDALHRHDDRPPYMRGVNRHGTSERPWPPQSLVEGGPLFDHGEPHERRMLGFRGESEQAMIRDTTIEVIVPSSLIPSICGEDGGCLRQIRQISDAKIVISEPRRGAPETLIIISGTPEQTRAAQSLIQAFVMIESHPDEY